HGITPCLRLFVHVQVCLYPRKSDSLMNVPFLVSPRLSLISSYAYCKHSCNDQPCCCANIIKVTTVSPIPSFKSSILLRESAAPISPNSSIDFSICLLGSALCNPFSKDQYSINLTNVAIVTLSVLFLTSFTETYSNKYFF